MGVVPLIFTSGWASGVNAYAVVLMLGLLGRLVATGVQNIRAYEAERQTVEELRRLSALRADFFSLVSHELRSPMAAVIGSARTLQQRWRQLAPVDRYLIEQRKTVLWAFVIACAVSAALIPLIQFDFNPFHLRNPKGEAKAPKGGVVLAIHCGPVMALGETLIHIGLDPRPA